MTKKWELIPDRPNLAELPRLSQTFAVALNDYEILICGGKEYTQPNVQIYDTRSDSCTSVPVSGALELYNHSRDCNNSIVKIGHNKVVALVLTGYKPTLIKYERETNSIIILKTFEDND